jgi:hypothetical protein
VDEEDINEEEKEETEIKMKNKRYIRRGEGI